MEAENFSEFLVPGNRNTLRIFTVLLVREVIWKFSFITSFKDGKEESQLDTAISVY